MTEPTRADDQFHPPASDDRWWTETSWYSFDCPGRRLSGSFYPLFRPNLGVCSLLVCVWDDTASEPWNARYFRELWHLPMPKVELTELRLEGLSYDRTEPLRSYRVRYQEGDLFVADLQYEALRAPHAMILGPAGHLDQPCRVTGSIRLGDEEIEVASLSMRDRSWSVRADDRTTRSAYTYATASADAAFLTITHFDGERYRIVAGYLVRDGKSAALVSGERRVVRAAGGWPERVEIDATDALGRNLEVSGRALNRLAMQASPGLFAWMSLFEWSLSGAAAYGQDQDIWSPDLLAAGTMRNEARRT